MKIALLAVAVVALVVAVLVRSFAKARDDAKPLPNVDWAGW